MFEMATTNCLTPMVKYEVHSPLSHNPTPNSTPGSIHSLPPPSQGGKGEEMGSKVKRKINFSHLGIPKGHGHQPATVARRNARERNRVKQVNNGFAALKQHIPPGHRSKKMSKVETLKCAVEYIRNLKDMLDLNSSLLTSPAASSSSSTTSSNNYSDGTENYCYGGDYFSNQGEGLSPTSSSEPDPASPMATSAPYQSAQHSHPSSQQQMSYDYENYEPVSPEDEELLDAISWWQQS